MLLADSIWIDAWPNVPGETCAGVDPQRGTNNFNLGRLCIDRHSGGIDLAFIDGHVKWSHLTKLPEFIYKGY